jgi:RNA polymerase I-associated factor PAF67
MLLRAKCPIFLHPKVKNHRAHCRCPERSKSRGNCVSNAHLHSIVLRITLHCEYREIVGEYGSKHLYKMLGYFSIIGLLRVHTLLGDYTLALKVMDHIELNQKVGD